MRAGGRGSSYSRHCSVGSCGRSRSPPWQGPDEPAHFAYVQRIATEGSIPALDHSPPDYFADSTERIGTRDRLSGPFARASRLRNSAPRIAGVSRPSAMTCPRTSHGDLISVWKYPPAYYLIAAPAYLLPFLHTDTERMYAVRGVSAMIGAIAVWLVFLLLLEAGVDAPDRAARDGLTYSLLPMVSQASAIGNPDILADGCARGARAQPAHPSAAGWTLLTCGARLTLGDPRAADQTDRRAGSLWS